MYAIVDIETTGGSAKKHRMTEIAIIHHDGEKETGPLRNTHQSGSDDPAQHYNTDGHHE